MSSYFLNKAGVVYLHIPKTAKAQMICDAMGGEHSGPHFGHIPKEWEHLFAFAFVRDPITRFCTAFASMSRPDRTTHLEGLGEKPRDLSLAEFAEIALDDSIAHDDEASMEAEIRRATLPMTHPFNCLHLARFVGRFENARADAERLVQYLGLQANLTPAFEAAQAGSDVELSPALKDRLAVHYREDERFLESEMPRRNRLPDRPLTYAATAFLARAAAEEKAQKQGKKAAEPLEIDPLELPPVKHGMPIEGPHSIGLRGGAHLLDGPPALIYHAPRNMMQSLIDGHFPLHCALAGHAANQGVRVMAVHASPRARKLVEQDDRHLHIFMDNFPLYRRNLFHSIPSYLYGFWYFDELAPRNNSSTRLSRFDRRAVYPPYATKVLTRLRYKLVETNLSKFEQRERGETELEEGSLVFYAQNFFNPHLYPDYMPQKDMIEAAIAARGDRRLYIKPHPIQKPDSLEYLHSLHDPGRGVEVTKASVHDLNAVAAATISLTSACAFEGFLQRTPAILGGQSDFHHNAITLTDKTKMADAIEAALSYDWPYAQYVTWFLKHECVEDRPSSLPLVLERVYRKGFAWADAKGAGFFGPQQV